MTKILAAFGLALFVSGPALADVVELKTGQRVEGTLKQADQTSVSVEVGGQVVTFKAEQVRAVYYGAAPAIEPPAALKPGARALAALRALKSVAEAGTVYRDYVSRVADAKVEVDRDSVTSSELNAALGGAMNYYILARNVWQQQVSSRTVEDQFTNMYLPLMDDKGGCQQIPALKTRFWSNSSDKAQLVSEIVALVWICAADQLAAAEKLLAEKK